MKESLLAADPGVPVETAHIISRRGLRSAERWHAQLGIENLPDYIEKGYRLSAMIDAGEIAWKIITMFRDPVARIISGFFQDATRLYPDEFPAHGEWGYHDVESHLSRQFSELDPDEDFTFQWFDRELRAVFAVDAYAFPFDHVHGFVRTDGPQCDVLIMQYEKLSETFPACVPAFLGIRKTSPLLRVNDSREKPYSGIYRHTLEHFRLSRTLCETLYSTRFAVHFFRESVRQQMIERWSR